MLTPSIRTPWVLACLLAMHTPLLAQQEMPPPFEEPVRLAPEPILVANLGLAVMLPVDVSVQTDELPGGSTRLIAQPKDGRWVLQIYNSRSNNLELTPSQALASILEQRLESGPIRNTPLRNSGQVERESLLQIIDVVEELRIGAADGLQGPPAARAYIVEREGEGLAFPPVGYTVLRTDPGHFVTLQLDCLPDDFAHARRVYETIIASLRASDPDRQARERSLALQSGRLFLENISREDLDELMGTDPVWYRIYAPAPSGAPADAQEIGYQRVEIRQGQLGELNRDRNKIEWTTEERTFGYLVKLQARTLETPTSNAEPGKVVTYLDTIAYFFLSRDRTEEFWNIWIEYQQDGQPRRVSQGLIRRDTRITVRTNLDGAAAETADYDVVEGHYLSGVERFVLPMLIAKRAGEDQGALFNLGFYTFDTTRSAITFRSERFEGTPGGGWIQTTTPHQNALPWTTTRDRAGALIKQALPPDRAVEPITLEALHRLWTSKGLPTG